MSLDQAACAVVAGIAIARATVRAVSAGVRAWCLCKCQVGQAWWWVLYMVVVRAGLGGYLRVLPVTEGYEYMYLESSCIIVA